MRFVNRAGMVIGKLTVLALAPVQIKGKNARWLCRCQCGNETIVSSGNLSPGRTVSCGCFGKTVRVTHGATRQRRPAREYVSWSRMIARCSNENRRDYRYYGARGISVCDRWRRFENFLSDMGPCPPGHSIDRIDNDRHYSPDNCRWTTPKQQMRNRSDNRTITFAGETLCVSEWAERIGCRSEKLVKRLNRGWSDARTITAH